jgi:hypothetical protein
VRDIICTTGIYIYIQLTTFLLLLLLDPWAGQLAPDFHVGNNNYAVCTYSLSVPYTLTAYRWAKSVILWFYAVSMWKLCRIFLISWRHGTGALHGTGPMRRSPGRG